MSRANYRLQGTGHEATVYSNQTPPTKQWTVRRFESLTISHFYLLGDYIENVLTNFRNYYDL